MKKLIIFTDLDGTLLDYSAYSFEAALPALYLIKERNIPLIICSSKTRKEIEHYREKLGNLHPFISENGGGIYIPKGYFESRVKSQEFREGGVNYNVIRLGAKYADLRSVLNTLRSEGFDIKGFGDMTVEEVAGVTGLSVEEAMMAKERDFDEPFLFKGGGEETERLFERIQGMGFNYTQGRFFHILGNSDKGKAVSVLIDLFKREHGDVVTVAIGDSPNDIPMLERADYPVVVQKPDGSYDPQIIIPNVLKANGIGPAGWNEAVMKLKEIIS
jgi:mannosyl-3-phosphoglycerate phosphatase family protein